MRRLQNSGCGLYEVAKKYFALNSIFEQYFSKILAEGFVDRFQKRYGLDIMFYLPPYACFPCNLKIIVIRSGKVYCVICNLEPPQVYSLTDS